MILHQVDESTVLKAVKLRNGKYYFPVSNV